MSFDQILFFSIINDFFFCSFNQKLNLAQQQMTADYSKLKKEEEEKSAKLQELT